MLDKTTKNLAELLGQFSSAPTTEAFSEELCKRQRVAVRGWTWQMKVWRCRGVSQSKQSLFYSEV